MLRLTQNVLFVFGATAAAVVLAVGLAFLAALMAFPAGRDAGGAAIAFVIVAIGAGISGALVGLAGSITWIARQSAASWSVGTWIGLILGLMAGFAIRNSTILERIVLGDVIEWLPGMIVFLAAMAFLGGVIGGIATARVTGQDRTSLQD